MTRILQPRVNDPYLVSSIMTIIYFKPFKIIINNANYFCLLFDMLTNNKRNHKRCSVTKGDFRNFAKFTEKHLCQSLFFISFLVRNCSFFMDSIFCSSVALVWSFNTRDVYNSILEKQIFQEIWCRSSMISSFGRDLGLLGPNLCHKMLALLMLDIAPSYNPWCNL